MKKSSYNLFGFEIKIKFSSESTIIIGTLKDIWKISFKDKKPSIIHLKTLGSNYPNNYFTCLETWKIKNDNYLIVYYMRNFIIKYFFLCIYKGEYSGKK